jgi:uncharacterized protein (TIGR03437 family)
MAQFASYRTAKSQNPRARVGGGSALGGAGEGERTICAFTALFAGLAPGFVGLYQLNVPIPAAIQTSGDLPIVVTASGVQGKTVTIPVTVP